MDGEADDPPRVLVHDHENPITSQNRGLAPEQVDAPPAVFRMPQERQPGGATRVGVRAIVRGEHTADYVLVDLDVEGQPELLRNPRTAPHGVLPLHLDNSSHQFCGRPRGTRTAMALR